MIQASAPGKLYIAGEYAVLEPGHPALIVALDQFITVTLKEAKKQGSICSSYSNGISIPWTRKNGKFCIDERENPFSYITKSVSIVEQYLQELNYDLKYFDLTVESELDNKDGRKYGLGSSGAVTIATIKAMLTFYNIQYTAELLYKLAAITHLSLNSNGSFGDLAASSYEGWVAYSCFNREWALDYMTHNNFSISQMVTEKWPQLMIQQLSAPKDLRLLIGWTGSPASTTFLVDQINDEQNDMNGFYKQFLIDSRACVNQLIQAFKDDNIPMIQECIRSNRELLQSLAKISGVDIETQALTDLCTSAEKANGAAKSSGAGGGDCGIVLFNQQDEILPMINEWRQHDIVNLPLQVYRNKNTNHQPIIWEEEA
ncbi:phosphomevalonate kinase [Vagococcus penaei]|uniref:phosphomevalonate kinase n=1 Tax=Vagococcus penaei TaxID=633807 RepID=A0A1Q2D522_9ENTE|nr:phosphomevalonate kinase [Vagococcus penaei]AQP53459.1 phosphomevalonate kinase [Vagococcus penaei]RSU00849.1 phosphomevalonate kinase [Vagococcus penaei]